MTGVTARLSVVTDQLRMDTWQRMLRLLVASGLALAFVQPLAAADREYVLKWTQPDAANVQGYRVHVRPDSEPEQIIDVGGVQPDADGISRFPLLLAAEVGHHIRMTAYNGVGESAPSNQLFVVPSVGAPSACDDGDSCTADDSTAAGCTHAALPDGILCGAGGEVCLSGVCSVAECSVDADCADANVCDGSARCESFRCVAGTPPPDCRAASQCMTGVCDPQAGCLQLPVADGTRCDDGKRRTWFDRCQGGSCVGSASGDHYRKRRTR